MRKRRRSTTSSSITFINVTPLIDVFLFLLIVYMITVPLTEYQLNVSPPELNAQNIQDKNNYYVTLDKNLNLFFQNKLISKDELKNELQKLQQTDPNITIFLRADGECKYSDVIQIMKYIKLSGIDHISLITQAETS